MSWKSVGGWLVLIALLLVAVSNRSARRQQSRAVSLLSAEPFAGTGGADDAAANKLLQAVRQQVASVQQLTRSTQAVDAELETALRDAAATPSAVARQCAVGCTEHGNCNELTGECTCGLTRTGPACETPTMPACSLGGAPSRAASLEGWARGGASQRFAFGGDPTALSAGGSLDDVVNLSFLAAEDFWAGMRNVMPKGDERRTNVRYRWVGMVTCACVEQV